MSKEELIEVFNDTQVLCSKRISTRICISETIILDGSNDDELLDIYENKHEEPVQIKVTNRDTLTAAQEYSKFTEGVPHEGFVGILNFASATTPGGGVTKGSSAQEECICRCTSLYPALNQDMCWDKYYEVNRKANNNIGSDTIIYTPDVLVLKDKDYNLLEDTFHIDVITCAAPNLRDNQNNTYNAGASKTPLTLTDQELYDVHVKRARHIFDVANKQGVDYLVLGAFGCGAFKNNPEVVAKAYKDVLPDYTNKFKVIDFAIIDGKYTNNYEIFKKILL